MGAQQYAISISSTHAFLEDNRSRASTIRMGFTETTISDILRCRIVDFHSQPGRVTYYPCPEDWLTMLGFSIKITFDPHLSEEQTDVFGDKLVDLAELLEIDMGGEHDSHQAEFCFSNNEGVDVTPAQRETFMAFLKTDYVPGMSRAITNLYNIDSEEEPADGLWLKF